MSNAKDGVARPPQECRRVAHTASTKDSVQHGSGSIWGRDMCCHPALIQVAGIKFPSFLLSPPTNPHPSVVAYTSPPPMVTTAGGRAVRHAYRPRINGAKCEAESGRA